MKGESVESKALAFTADRGLPRTQEIDMAPPHDGLG